MIRIPTLSEFMNEDFSKSYDLGLDWWEKWKKINGDKYQLDKDDYNGTTDVLLYGEKVFTYDPARGKAFTDKELSFFLAD